MSDCPKLYDARYSGLGWLPLVAPTNQAHQKIAFLVTFSHSRMIKRDSSSIMSEPFCAWIVCGAQVRVFRV